MPVLRLFASASAPRAVILIRLMVGAVFLSEGIQKFFYPEDRGPGRFEKIGLPEPGCWPTSSASWRSSAGRWCCWAC